MSFTVTMPQLGETVTEGTILRWVKQPGDTVAEDDVLLEISTDKVDTEVPSPFAGTLLEILVPEGETVDVGTALAIIGEPGEETATAAPPVEQEEPAPAAPAPTPPAEEPAPAAVPASEATGDVGILSPVVRRLAAEHGVDLAAVTGTGKGGRITRRDVETFVAAGVEAPAAPEPEAAPVAPTPPPEPAPAAELAPAAEPAPAAPEPAATPEKPAAAAPEEPAPEPAAAPEEPVPVAPAPSPPPVAAEDGAEPLQRLRIRIAENMIRSKQTAAHVWTSVEVDFENVERVRRSHKEAFKEREGFSLTYLPFIARATIDALSAFPVVNSSFDLEAGTRTLHGAVNLGIGVDLNQEGLVVMTARGADGLRLRGIAREVRRLADKARQGKLEPDDVVGSTFTITNAGPYGSFMSAPIINLPNVAILSTDGIKKRPVVITDDDGTDAIAIHHVGYLSLTWDHRAFDGSTAVLFLRRIQEDLETWDWEHELA